MGESYHRFLTLIVVCLAVYVGLHHKDWLNKLNPARTTLPEHLLNHPVDFKEGLLSPETGSALMDLVLKAKTFPSNIAADLKTGGFRVQHEHIGEGRAIQADGTCDHPFLTPSPNRKVCYLPQRIDVGRHFILTGGPDGTRESFQEMLQRVTSFGRYYMGAEALENLSPIVKELFNEPNFEKAAKSVCPVDKQFLDPFQFNFIMQIPGQTVATHIDAPYFWGASRKLFPQWLLAVMVFSNLFKDNFIDQVQVVGYLSEYDTNNTDMGGDFIYYTDNSEGRGEYKSVPALHLAGSSVDGSKVAHASRIYQPKVKVPPMSKDKNSELVYTGADDAWELQVDGETIANYKTSDLRISVVYRGRCFAHENERDAYLEQSENSPGMDLEVVLRKLVDNMEAMQNEGTIYEGSNDAGAARRESLLEKTPEKRLDLALALMDFYLKYPLPSVQSQPHMPWNYCALTKALPSWMPKIEIC